MAWIETAAAVYESAKLVNDLAQSSPKLIRLGKRLARRISHGETVIPILGAGGVGKSSISRILAGGDPVESIIPYKENWETLQHNLTGDIPGKILDAPGQARRVDRSWPELFLQVNTGRAKCIVNVVSYGFHSFTQPTSYKSHDCYVPRMGVQQFVAEYTKHRRESEIDLLEKTLAGLSAVTTPIWFITVVNKQDLWIKSSEAVKSHYEHGRYGELLTSFSHAIGARNFHHEFIPGSLTIGNFVTSSGELLLTNTSGYDMKAHQNSLQAIVEHVSKVIERK